MQTDRVKILLVEDVPVYVNLLQRILSSCNIDSDTAGCLAEGIEKSCQGGYDAALLDLGLPDSFGLETFTSFNRACPNLPIVILTGLDDEELAVTVVKQGAQDYLIKGSYLTKETSGKYLLMRSIRNAIERKQIQDDLRKERDNLDLRVKERTSELEQANALLVKELAKRKEAEAALRASQARNQALLNAIPDVIARLNQDGIILDWKSPSGKLPFPCPFSDFIGRPIAECIPNFAPQGNQYLVQALKTKKIQIYEHEILMQENKIYLEIRMVTINKQEALLMLRDITERKIAEEQIRLSRERLRHLTASLVTAQEDERHRISLELHDDAGQTLTALNLSLALIQHELPSEFESLHEYIGNVIKLSETAMQRIRELSHVLRPPSLDAVGLNQTINDHCQKVAKQSGLEIDYTGIELLDLPNHIQISLYRVLQEALTNVIKHSQAQKVAVRLDYDQEMLSLLVQDNGKGFDRLMNPNEMDGIGLLGMQERIESLGGKLDIQSTPSQGASVLARVPWKEEA